MRHCRWIGGILPILKCDCCKERIPESPMEVVKDPMYLEFLGLEHKTHYYESELEDSLITHLQESSIFGIDRFLDTYELCKQETKQP